MMVSARGGRLAYMTFTSLGSNLGAVHRVVVSILGAAGVQLGKATEYSRILTG